MKKPTCYKELDECEIEYDGGKVSAGDITAIVGGIACLVGVGAITGLAIANRGGCPIVMDEELGCFFFRGTNELCEPAGLFGSKAQAETFATAMGAERYTIGKVYGVGYAVYNNNLPFTTFLE